MKFDPGPYIRGIVESNRREAAEIAERAEEARREATRLALRILENDPEVRAVYLFGSLAADTPTHRDFDIDLALDGGDSDRARDCVDESPFAVDVIRLNLVPDHFRKGVIDRGIVLAARATGRRDARP